MRDTTITDPPLRDITNIPFHTGNTANKTARRATHGRDSNTRDNNIKYSQASIIPTLDRPEPRNLKQTPEHTPVVPPLPPCTVGTVRFIHINTGGICSKKKLAEFKLLLTNLSQSQADIYSVNEVNLDTTQAQIKKDLYDIGQTEIKHGQQFYSTSKESYPRAFKPGGTMLGLAPHMASRREDHGSDSKGRWT